MAEAQLEAAFTQALLEQLVQAEAATGIAETRLRDQAQTAGGAAAVRTMLAKGQQTRQFAKLQAIKRLDLSVEALAVQSRFGELFTDEEADLCLQTLLEAGMYDL